MKMLVIAAVAACSFAGAAQAGISDQQFLKAARCRGLAASEALGKLDTATLDALLRAEAGGRDLAVQTSANNKIIAARKEADAANDAKKVKLLAEREQVCAAFVGGAQ